MSLVQTSAADLTLMLQTLTGVNLTGDYQVVGVLPTTESDPTSHNTKAMLQGTTPYQGYQVVYYDRLPLADLANFDPYLVSMTPDVSVLTQLQVILNQYGINLTSADIEDATTESINDGANTQVTLTALSTSLGWTGTVTLTFAGLPPISNAFYGNVLAGF